MEKNIEHRNTRRGAEKRGKTQLVKGKKSSLQLEAAERGSQEGHSILKTNVYIGRSPKGVDWLVPQRINHIRPLIAFPKVSVPSHRLTDLDKITET